jgi:hypothetical protein
LWKVEWGSFCLDLRLGFDHGLLVLSRGEIDAQRYGPYVGMAEFTPLGERCCKGLMIAFVLGEFFIV